MNAKEDAVLCVDLDGTLIRSDMLLETFLSLAKQNPLRALIAPFWLLRGKANLKHQIAKSVKFDPALLPYNQEVIEFIAEEKAKGRKVVLATASNQELAQAIAEHLGLFDEVLASSETANRVGKSKLLEIKERYARFDYAGNEKRDLHIWKDADKSILVSSNKGLVNSLKKRIDFEKIIEREEKLILNILKAMRVHQWVKNTLLFAPLLFAHEFSQGLFLKALYAFFSFGLCASSFYIFNDLMDISSDRAHPKKKDRPFASGALSITTGIILIPLLLAGSVGLSLLTEPGFFTALVTYAVLTTVYSTTLKKIMVLDLLILSSFYTIRLFAGALATNVVISEWLLGFSMFLFISLGCVKRFSELYEMRKRDEVKAKGRGYVLDDLEPIAHLGSACGYISVLVMALYVSSDEVRALYHNPGYLWFVCPILFYWIARVWILAHRGQMNEDPIVFALSDVTSYLAGILCVLITLWAI